MTTALPAAPLGTPPASATTAPGVHPCRPGAARFSHASPAHLALKTAGPLNHRAHATGETP